MPRTSSRTANTARDLARVLDALHLGKVDLYGDSYGTFFAQSFLSRYPGRLRSVVLDSAYEARDLDPWYRTTPTDRPPRLRRGLPAGRRLRAGLVVAAGSASWPGRCAAHPVERHACPAPTPGGTATPST